MAALNTKAYPRPDLADLPNVFPFLKGQSFGQKKPLWSTTTLSSKSGRVFRKQNFSFPIWQFNLSFASLAQKATRMDLDRIWAFFNSCAGQYGSFLYYDPYDNAVTGQPIGVGDGVTTQFQLMRSVPYGGNFAWEEPVYAENGRPVVTVDGVATNAFSIIAPGVVKLTSAPGIGSVVSWTGSFYFYCHFTQDDLNVQQLNSLLWSNDGLTFETIKL